MGKWVEGWKNGWLDGWMIDLISVKLREIDENFHGTQYSKKQNVSSGFDIDCKLGNPKAFNQMSVISNRMRVRQR